MANDNYFSHFNEQQKSTFNEMISHMLQTENVTDQALTVVRINSVL